MPRYRRGDKIYNIPADRMGAFLSKYRDAERVLEKPAQRDTATSTSANGEDKYVGSRDVFGRAEKRNAAFKQGIEDTQRRVEEAQQRREEQKTEYHNIKDSGDTSQERVFGKAAPRDLSQLPAVGKVSLSDRRDGETGWQAAERKAINRQAADQFAALNHMPEGIDYLRWDNKRIADAQVKAKNERDIERNAALKALPTYKDRVDYAKQNKAEDERHAGYSFAIKQLTRDTEERLAEAAKTGNTTFMEGFGRGVRDKATNPATWLMGIADNEVQKAVKRVVDKYERLQQLKANEQQVSDADELTTEEWRVLNAFAQNAHANGYDVGLGYKAGTTTVEAVPFMAEMYFNPAAGAGKTVSKFVGKKLLEQGAKGALSKFMGKAAVGATRVAGDVVGAAGITATTGYFQTAADAQRRMIGEAKPVDENFGYTGVDETTRKSAGEAWGEAFAAGTIERWSEMLGQYFAPVSKGAGTLARKGMQRMGLGKVNTLMDRVTASQAVKIIDKMKDKGQVQDLFGEWSEEMIGGTMNALTVGDQKLTGEGGVWNWDNMLETAVVLAPMQVFFGVAKLGAGAATTTTPQQQARRIQNRAAREARRVFGEDYDIISQLVASANSIVEDENGRVKWSEAAAEWIKNERGERDEKRERAMMELVHAARAQQAVDQGIASIERDEEIDPAAREQVRQVNAGFNAAYNEEAAKAVRSEYEVSRKNAAIVLGINEDDIDSAIDAYEDTAELYEELDSDEARAAVLDYVQKRATYNGLQAGNVEQQLDAWEAEEEEQAARTNKTTGRVEPIMHRGRRAYIVSSENADSYVIRYEDNNEVRMVSPRDVTPIENGMPAEDGQSAQTDSTQQPELNIKLGTELQVQADNGEYVTATVNRRAVDGRWELETPVRLNGYRIGLYSMDELAQMGITPNQQTQNTDIQNEEKDIYPAVGDAVTTGQPDMNEASMPATAAIPKQSDTGSVDATGATEQSDVNVPVPAAVANAPEGEREDRVKFYAGLPMVTKKGKPAREWDGSVIYDFDAMPPMQAVRYTEYEDGIEGAVIVAKQRMARLEKTLKKNYDPRIRNQMRALQAYIDEAPFRMRSVAQTGGVSAQAASGRDSGNMAAPVSAEVTESTATSQAEYSVEGIPEYQLDTPSAARERGYRVQSGYAVPRNGSIAVQGGVETTRKFSVEAQDEVPVRRVIVDVSLIEPSHTSGAANVKHFIPEAQPKERTDKASNFEAGRIAANINPAQITGGVGAFEGAPIINGRGEVIQGNNRVIALKQMYSHNMGTSIDRYKQYLAEHATEYGMTREQVMEMKTPVAVDMADISDNEAQRLGGKTQKDLESGGIHRIEAANVTGQLSVEAMEKYVDILFRDIGDEGATLREYVRANGQQALNYINERKIISTTQYQSALKNGNLTPEAIDDLLSIAQSSLFTGGAQALPQLFGKLPVGAQSAIVRSLPMLSSLNAEDKAHILGELRSAIELYGREQTKIDKAHKPINGRTAQENLRSAMKTITKELDPFTRRSYSDDFSAFAIELAIRMKARTQTELYRELSRLLIETRGMPADLFGDAVKYSVQEATDRFMLGYDSKEILNEELGSAALAQRASSEVSGANEKMHSSNEKLQPVEERVWQALIGKLWKSGLAKKVHTDKKEFEEYLRKHGINIDTKAAEDRQKKNEARWHKDLAAFTNGTLKGVLHLGMPGVVLRSAGVKADKTIIITAGTLRRHLAKHGLSIEDIQGLAEAIQQPVMVYEWGKNHPSTVIITELTTADGRKLSIAIRAENKGSDLSVSEVASVHGKVAERLLEDFGKADPGYVEEHLRWVEKRKVLNWLSTVPPKGTGAESNQGLNQNFSYSNNTDVAKVIKTSQAVAKVIQKFENPRTRYSYEDGTPDVRVERRFVAQIVGDTWSRELGEFETYEEAEQAIQREDLSDVSEYESVSGTIRESSRRVTTTYKWDDDINPVYNEPYGWQEDEDIEGEWEEDYDNVSDIHIADTPQSRRKQREMEKEEEYNTAKEALRGVLESEGWHIVGGSIGKYTTIEKNDVYGVIRFSDHSYNPDNVREDNFLSIVYVPNNENATRNKWRYDRARDGYREIVLIEDTRVEEYALKEIAWALQEWEEVRLMKTVRGEVYGFVTAEGEVYLNIEKMNGNTPIHEFGHLWNSYVKENDPALWKRSVELIRDSVYMRLVQANPAYKSLSEEEQIDEAMATAIGDKGEKILHAGELNIDVAGDNGSLLDNVSRFEAFVQWLREMWGRVKEVLPARGASMRGRMPKDAEARLARIKARDTLSIGEMTLEEFTTHAVEDLVSGTDMYNGSGAGANTTVEDNEQEREVLEQIHRAEAEVDTNPTEAQKKAGNYKKGHVTIQGLNISIEQPKGSVRRGVDENGNSWETTMQNTYGYFGNTESLDGDHIDVFLGDRPLSKRVFVVDQIKPETGKFDEHKVMLGFTTIEEAKEAYLSNYEKGWKSLGNITEVDISNFEAWATKDGARIKPFADYKSVDVSTLSENDETTQEDNSGKDRFFTVYHGSPYRFDKFSSDRIGTGEGAQAFGYGLYFTDKRGIAEYYARSVSGDREGLWKHFLQSEKIPKQYRSWLKKLSYNEGGGILSNIVSVYRHRKDITDYIENKIKELEDEISIAQQSIREADEKLTDVPAKWDKLAWGANYAVVSYRINWKNKNTVNRYLRYHGKVQIRLRDVVHRDMKKYSDAVEKHLKGDENKITDLYNLTNDFWDFIDNPTQFEQVEALLPAGLSDKQTQKIKDAHSVLWGSLVRYNQSRELLEILGGVSGLLLNKEVDTATIKSFKAERGLLTQIAKAYKRDGMWAIGDIEDMVDELSANKTVYEVKVHGDKSVEELNFLDHGKYITNEQYKNIVEALSEYLQERAAVGGREVSRNDLLRLADGNSISPIIKSEAIEMAFEREFALTPREASAVLLRAGIDGYRYEANRGRSDGHNYVVFDDAVVEIDDRELLYREGLSIEQLDAVAEMLGVERTEADRVVVELGAKDGGTTKVIVVSDGAQIPNGSERMQAAKGWYNKRTGEVYVIAGNHESVEDVERTVLHEIVGHRGLRGLLGERGFARFISSVLKDMRRGADLRDVYAEVQRMAAERGVSEELALEEWLAEMAEHSAVMSGRDTRSFFGKILEFLRDAISQVHIWAGRGITERDLRYVLWKSYQLSNRQGLSEVLTVARDVVMQQRMGVEGIEAPVVDMAERNAIVEAAIDAGTYMQAPNGKPSRLTPAEWVRVRTTAFKERFGDWEKAARVEKLRNSEDAANITAKDYEGKYELNRAGVKKYIKDNLRGTYANKDTDEDIEVSAVGADKVTSHGEREEAHLKSIVAIPQLIENSIFIEEHPAEKSKAHYDRYRYYVAGIKIDDEDYTVRIVVGIRNGRRYYDHALTQIEKGHLIASLNTRSNRVAEQLNALSGYKDKKLISILSTDHSNILDDNGEPTVTLEGENDEILFRDNTGSGQRRRKPVLEITEGEIARAWYEKSLNENSYYFHEGWQNNMLSAKKFVEATYKEVEKFNTNKKGERQRRATVEDLPDHENFYLLENQLSSKNTAEAEIWFRQYFKPMLHAVRAVMDKGKHEYEEVLNYMIAKHGLERNAVMSAKAREAGEAVQNDGDYSGLKALTLRDGEELDDNTEFTQRAQEMVREFEGTYTDQLLERNEDDKTVVDVMWEQVNAATYSTLEKSYTSGVISEHQLETVAGMYSHYIPLRGWAETNADELYEYLTSHRSNFNAPLKSAKGRTSIAEDPLAHIAQMAESAISEGNRNEVKQAFYNFVVNNETSLAHASDVWYVLDNETGMWKMSLPEVSPAEGTTAAAVEKHEKRMSELAQQGLAQQFKRAELNGVKITPTQLPEHAVKVKMAGMDKMVFINGNPRVAQALNGLLTGEPTDEFTAASKRAMRAMAANFTMRNPGFIISNAARDIGQTLFNAGTSKEGVKYNAILWGEIGKNIPGMFYLIRKAADGKLNLNNERERYFDEFLRNGGETGYMHLKSIEKFKTDIQNELSKASGRVDMGKVVFMRDGRWMVNDNIGLKGARKVLSGIEMMNRSAEDISRFAIYVASRKSGKTIIQSINDAKEITVNFNRRGSGARGNTFVSSLYMFMNASIQALNNHLTRWGKTPIKTTAGVLTMMAAGYAMNIIMGTDDDDEGQYKDISDFVRRSNWMIPIGGGKWVSIPLPIELRAWFGLGDIIYKWSNAREVDKVGKNVIGEVAGQLGELLPLNPVGGGGLFEMMLPDIIKPVSHISTNKNFMGNPLYIDNDFNKNVPEWRAAYKRTNKTVVKFSKLISECTGGDQYSRGWLEIPPAAMEELLNGYFGGFGDMFLGALSAITPSSLTDVRQIPVVKKFIKDGERGWENRIQNTYYNLTDEMKREQKRYKDYQKDDDYLRYAQKIAEMDKSPEMARSWIMKSHDKVIGKYKEALKAAGEDSPEGMQLKNEMLMRMAEAINEAEMATKNVKK